MQEMGQTAKQFWANTLDDFNEYQRRRRTEEKVREQKINSSGYEHPDNGDNLPPKRGSIDCKGSLFQKFACGAAIAGAAYQLYKTFRDGGNGEPQALLNIPSPTVTPSVTPTNAPTITPTITPTISPTATSTLTPTLTPTRTPTRTPSRTPQPTPSLNMWEKRLLKEGLLE